MVLAEPVVTAAPARVATAEAFTAATATEAFPTTPKTLGCVIPAKRMEAVRLSLLLRKARSSKALRGTSPEIMALKACCRRTIGLLSTPIGRRRPAGVEAGSVSGATVLLCRVHRRLHVVGCLLRRPCVAYARRLVTPVVTLRRASESLSVS